MKKEYDFSDAKRGSVANSKYRQNLYNSFTLKKKSPSKNDEVKSKSTEDDFESFENVQDLILDLNDED